MTKADDDPNKNRDKTLNKIHCKWIETEKSSFCSTDKTFTN